MSTRRRCKSCRLATLAAATALATAGPAHALEFVSSAGLANFCRTYLARPDHEEGRYCAAYVRGFIDGSPLIAVQRQPREAESYSQRAVRTRLGRTATVRPLYCIDAAVELRTLIEQVIAVADRSSPRDDVDAGVLLYATLSQHYACAR